MKVRCAWPAVWLLVLASTGTAAAQQAKAGWRSLIPKSELSGKFGGGELYAVEFLNHNVGWTVGGHANATMMFRTVDGGETWERLSDFDGEQHVPGFTDIGFADANNGWMVGRYHILRTTDGGESWEPVDYGKDAPWATSLLVLGPDAIVIGSNVENKQIIRTMNGGKTWDVVSLYDHSNTEVSGLAFSPSNNAVFATVGKTHGSYGAIQRSNDGGLTWEVVVEADKPLLDVTFEGRNGVAVGQNIGYWTSDGGATWKRVVVPGWQHAADFIDANTVVAVGNRPHVVMSTNGGKTWRPVAPPNVGPSGSLVDIVAVDAGWWFVAGGYGANALFQFVDPQHLEPIETGELAIPVDITVDDEALPRGTYEVTLGHQGDEHVLVLEREGEVDDDAEIPGDLEKSVAAQEQQKPPACENPCTIVFPVEVTYEKEDLASGKAAKPAVKLSLQPSAAGIAIVLNAVLTPPRNFALALAGAGLQSTTTAETREVKEKARKSGGLLDRVKKAASGDLRGATAGANPAAVQQRVTTAKSAPPGIYSITLRHSVRLFSRKPANDSNR